MKFIPKGLIVSSQALDGNPMKDPKMLAAMAKAAELGGAVSIRANGADNIAEMKKLLTVPIIGLNKIADRDGTIIITPDFARAEEIASVGADIIALDATLRKSPIKQDTRELIKQIHDRLHLPVLADVSNAREAAFAAEAGADYISTTLSGYTKDRPYAPEDKYFPDFELLHEILSGGLSVPLIAEGRFWRAEDVERAMRMGVHGIVIGKAVTNPMAITEYFAKAAARGADTSYTVTESVNEQTKNIDRMNTYGILQKIGREDERAAHCVADCYAEIAHTVDEILPRFLRDGRLIYCGAGTSGRLGVADAAECPPTFGIPLGKVVAVIAGGRDAVFTAQEYREDDQSAGRAEAEKLAVCSDDSVILLSANGNAKFLLGFLKEVRSRGAFTCAIVNNRETALAAAAECKIELLTGAEVIKGSTRMKAGTAQKMALNMISTALFIRSGYVEGNLMVNIRPTNAKLHKRAVSMFCLLTGERESVAEKYFRDGKTSVKEAVERWRTGREE